jgi:hypothetical protein
METWIMVRAKRARTAERPTQPSLDLRSRAPWFYPDRSTASSGSKKIGSPLATRLYTWYKPPSISTLALRTTSASLLRKAITTF